MCIYFFNFHKRKNHQGGLDKFDIMEYNIKRDHLVCFEKGNKMGATRNNQSRAVTENKIRDLIREILAKGQTAFPSERELTVRLDAARTVIRSILEKMESKGQLLRTPNGRIINSEANRAQVLFIGHGRSMFANWAWALLYQSFCDQAPAGALSPRAQLIGFWPEEIEHDLAELQKSSAKYIVVTESFQDDSKIIRKWLSEGRTVIGVDEDLTGRGFPIISLDNAKVGKMAADELYRHGFRHPALLLNTYDGKRYLPFDLRLDAYSKRCGELGMKFDRKTDLYDIGTSKGRLQWHIKSVTKIANDRNYDSLFAVSGENLPLIAEVLNEQGRPFPGEFGLIAFDVHSGIDTFHTRISAVSDAPEKIAEVLVRNIQKHADRMISEIPTIKCSPPIQKGETLCLRNV